MTSRRAPRNRVRDHAQSAPRALLRVCGVVLAVLTVTVSLLAATHRHHDGSATPVSCAVCQAAEQAVRDGYNILILSDRQVAVDRLPIPALLATAAAAVKAGDGRRRDVLPWLRDIALELERDGTARVTPTPARRTRRRR